MIFIIDMWHLKAPMNYFYDEILNVFTLFPPLPTMLFDCLLKVVPDEISPYVQMFDLLSNCSSNVSLKISVANKH